MNATIRAVVAELFVIPEVNWDSRPVYFEESFGFTIDPACFRTGRLSTFQVFSILAQTAAVGFWSLLENLFMRTEGIEGRVR